MQIPNRIARHGSLSLEAVGLLTRLLSLPDANGATVERITGLVPNGRRSVSNAMNELITHGYLKRARVQDPETGRWVTLTSVTDSPGDRMPTVGEPTPQAVGGSPKGEKTVGSNDLPTVLPHQAAGAEGASEGEGQKSPQIEEDAPAPAPADAVTGRAVECLRSVGRIEPTLRLSARDSLRLAPLAAQWLSAGFREMEVVKAVTRSLPASVESAAAFVSYRLKNQPEKVSAPSEAPQAVPVHRERCPECEVIFPLGHQGGICRNCR
ncbi:hypothetical protein ACIRLA_28665 [Streptomyces sp. NPDC102364]|uniref:hypothetical protein n=1 Tax=Streptomyces sp. NPDC102364 TaxID=3366161 RepID=UPI00380AC693